MRKQTIGIIVFTLFAAGILAGIYLFSIPEQRVISCDTGRPSLLAAPQRIVSMAPNITEILFSLGQGDRVVGVTMFCNFPPEAKALPKVGGYYDPRYEEIVNLQPDLVILLASQQHQKDYLTTLGCTTLSVDNQSIAAILASIVTIGRVCGEHEKALSVVKDLKHEIAAIKKKTEGLPRPRVMVSVGRTLGTGTLEEIYIAGGSCFYHELIALAGGKNVYAGATIPYPLLTAEGILSLNPDLVIDMVPEMERQGLHEEAILQEWQVVSEIKAVKNDRLYLLAQDHAVIPGPRFIFLLKAMAHVIHPEVHW